MQLRKYSRMIAKGLCLFCFFSLCSHWASAQNDLVIDTAAGLKYQTDTRLKDSDTVKEEDSSWSDDEVMEDNKEYFLRKEFTGGLGDSLILQRRVADTALNVLRNDKAFWYANEGFKKNTAKKQGSLTEHPLFQIILWIVIIGGFVVFLFMYIANSNIGLFRRSTSINIDDESVEETDIFSIDYKREINAAVTAGDYRLATRLMFLQLLRNLSDRNIIQYKPDSTNVDYLSQLRSTGLHTSFAWLARNYEYSWYGHFELDNTKFEMIKKEFEMFGQKIVPVV